MQEKWFSHDWMVKKRNVGHSGKSGELRVVRGGGVGGVGVGEDKCSFLAIGF